MSGLSVTGSYATNQLVEYDDIKVEDMKGYIYFVIRNASDYRNPKFQYFDFRVGDQSFRVDNEASPWSTTGTLTGTGYTWIYVDSMSITYENSNGSTVSAGHNADSGMSASIVPGQTVVFNFSIVY